MRDGMNASVTLWRYSFEKAMRNEEAGAVVEVKPRATWLNFPEDVVAETALVDCERCDEVDSTDKKREEPPGKQVVGK